jgi:transcriptional regulator with XRE-family HTH domain
VARYPEGLLLRAFVEPRVRAADIARAGNLSRQYVSRVLAGEVKASERFLQACRDVGLPVDEVLAAYNERERVVAA